MIENFIGKKINVFWIDGRIFVILKKVGILQSIDNSANLILTMWI